MHFTTILSLLPGLALAIPAYPTPEPTPEPSYWETPGPTPTFWETPGATPGYWETPGATPTPSGGSARCYEGSASLYTGSFESSACRGAIPAPEAGELVATVNAKFFDTSSYCGANLVLLNKKGETLMLRVIDFCSDCEAGDIQISKAAFKQLSSDDVTYCYE